jgi:hypothetical protein
MWEVDRDVRSTSALEDGSFFVWSWDGLGLAPPASNGTMISSPPRKEMATAGSSI